MFYFTFKIFKPNLSWCLQGMFSSRMLFMAEAGQIQGMNHWDVLNLDLGQTEPNSGAKWLTKSSNFAWSIWSAVCGQTFRLHRTWPARVCISQDSQVWGSLDVLTGFVSADRLLIASPVPWLPDLPRGVSGSSRTSSAWRYVRQVLRRYARGFARKNVRIYVRIRMHVTSFVSGIIAVATRKLGHVEIWVSSKMGYCFKR